MPDANYKQILDGIVTDIQALAMTNLPSSKVKLRKFAWDDVQTMLGVSVSPDKEFEDSGTNARDDIAYPCLITIVQGTGKGLSDDLGRVTEWRQAIRRRFHNLRNPSLSLPTGSSHILTRVLHKDVEIPEKYRGSYDAEQMVVVVWIRESRT